jgi:succinate dehydrogenase / fumarate reductase membrane anchor subunit
MSLKTPLGRVLGLGSAKQGTDHWWGQRVSAVALIILGSWFVYALLRLDSLTYLDVIRFIGVIEDYVHAPGTKVVSLLLSRFAHAFVAIAAVYAILVIGIGS